MSIEAFRNQLPSAVKFDYDEWGIDWVFLTFYAQKTNNWFNWSKDLKLSHPTAFFFDRTPIEVDYIHQPLGLYIKPWAHQVIDLVRKHEPEYDVNKLFNIKVSRCYPKHPSIFCEWLPPIPGQIPLKESSQQIPVYGNEDEISISIHREDLELEQNQKVLLKLIRERAISRRSKIKISMTQSSELILEE